MLSSSIQVPAGRWAAAVSGGADSTALLHLCFGVIGHVVHLDHEVRGAASRGDAEFVRGLARRWGVSSTVTSLSAFAPGGAVRTSDEFRRARLSLYRQVVEERGLDGVLLAHHADDVAETVLQRLLRGSSFYGLRGIPADRVVEGVRLARPLLGARKAELVGHLRGLGIPWREDASNATAKYGRNRARQFLATRPALHDALVALAKAADAYVGQLDEATPVPAVTTPTAFWASVPHPVLAHAARRYLRTAVRAEELSQGVVDRFLAWASDAAAGRVFELPGSDWVAMRERGSVSLRPR